MRRRGLRWALAIVGVGVALSGCTHATSGSSPVKPRGSFDVDHGGAAVTVFYASHVVDPAHARIVVVMHGTNRNAETYCDSFAQAIGERNVMVLCPELADDTFPGVEGYNLGGMVDAEGRARPRDEWAFGVVDAAHTRALDMLGGPQRPFDMVGHSAGAQFVHRYVIFADHPHLRRAVAANAGWYTEIDDESEFPYGLKKAPMDIDAQRVLSADLTILLGSDDVEDKDLRRDDEADRQGTTRLERGMHAWTRANQAAQDRGMSLAWGLQVVPGAKHNHREMADAALEILDRP